MKPGRAIPVLITMRERLFGLLEKLHPEANARTYVRAEISAITTAIELLERESQVEVIHKRRSAAE